MESVEYRKINTFDDGRGQYKYYPNKWLVLEYKYNRGKIILQNAFDKEVIINTISTWKTDPYTDKDDANLSASYVGPS
jgi:hypothetical protein|uniref:Uncharacterized protein n=1 Tax=viral metagenome TaxID=1070528 RepID=A0A6C0C107_9ZZZZ